MECVSPARMILYPAASIHIRDSLQMELGIRGQHHHMLSVRRLMTTAGKFSGVANVVRKLQQQIGKQWYSSWITIVPGGCTGWFRITSIHWKKWEQITYLAVCILCYTIIIQICNMCGNSKCLDLVEHYIQVLYIDDCLVLHIQPVCMSYSCLYEHG